MVPVPPNGSPNDAFARVGAALLAVWPQVRDQTAGLSAAERSLLLDECGSDYRPLVELLLDIGWQVRPALAALGGTPQAANSWENTRAPLVHKLVATRYLQPEVVRWAVDVWGRVLGVAPPPALPVVYSTTDAPTTGSAPSRTSAGGPPRTSQAKHQPTVVSPSQVPAALRGVPSWAGGPVSPRIGIKPSALAAGGRLVVVGAPPSGPRYQPAERRAAIVFGVLLAVISIALSQALRARRVATATEGGSDRTELPADQMVASSADSLAPARLVAPEATPAPVLVAVPSDAAMEAVPPDISRSTDRSVERTAITGSVIEAGVGGRYVVTQRVRDVSGTENCDAVARALGAGRETLEVVAHQPGTTTFVLVTREVTGTLSSDGWFTAQPRFGTTNNVNWQFRMRGRFGPDGFSAVSETHTEAIIRWGRSQHCVVTADLTGRRLPG